MTGKLVVPVLTKKEKNSDVFPLHSSTDTMDTGSGGVRSRLRHAVARARMKLKKKGNNNNNNSGDSGSDSEDDDDDDGMRG